MSNQNITNFPEIIARDVLSYYLERLGIEYTGDDEKFLSTIAPEYYNIFCEQDAVSEVTASLEEGLSEHLIETGRLPSDEESLDSLIEKTHEIEKSCIEELEVRHVRSEGGGEGGSEHCVAVISYRERFYECQFAYYSHHGYDFDYCKVYEVAPKTVEVVKYFPV